MNIRHTTSMILVAGFLAGAPGCSSDPRCSEQNCLVLSACGLQLEGQPQNVGFCLTSGLRPGGGKDYCPEACQANGHGVLLDCIATHFGPDCRPPDGGGRYAEELIVTTCVPQSPAPPCGTNCTTCQNGCEASFSSCNVSCPTTGWSACTDCGYGCSQQLIGCSDGCPTN
jgi:hypothetical protein